MFTCDCFLFPDLSQNLLLLDFNSTNVWLEGVTDDFKFLLTWDSTSECDSKGNDKCFGESQYLMPDVGWGDGIWDSS